MNYTLFTLSYKCIWQKLIFFPFGIFFVFFFIFISKHISSISYRIENPNKSFYMGSIGPPEHVSSFFDDFHALYFLREGVGLFTPLPTAAFGGAELGADGVGAALAGWVLGWGISMGSLGGMIVLGVIAGFASGIFSPWRYTLTWRKKKIPVYLNNFPFLDFLIKQPKAELQMHSSFKQMLGLKNKKVLFGIHPEI